MLENKSNLHWKSTRPKHIVACDVPGTASDAESSSHGLRLVIGFGDLFTEYWDIIIEN
jgi:hypothetical protein